MRDRKKFNSYHRDYQLRRYHKRREEAVQKLGGRCVQCGSTNKLEFDHIDRSQKTFDIGKLWGPSVAKFEAELAKCRLLCQPCHEAKSIADLGKQRARGQHGTISSYRYCRCEECKKAKAVYNKEWQRRMRGSVV